MSGAAEERIDIGADVLTVDGEKVGSVVYVVVQPETMRLTDIVVSTGAILGRDIVVPIDAVTGVAAGEVRLSMDRGQLEGCPDYVEIRFKQPPESWMPAGGFTYPAQAMVWPAGTNYPEPESVTVNAPPNTVGVHRGMDVESSDRHKVGTVDAVDADPSTDEVRGIVVKQGFLFTHDTIIPVTAVAGVENDKVTLNLTRDEVRRLEAGSQAE